MQKQLLATTRRNLKAIVLLAALFAQILPPYQARAAGATLYLSPASGTYVIGGTFSVSVKVNSGGQGINAAEGTISYDTNLLDATGVSTGGSIFPFWTTQPSISGGSIRFGGGLPPPAYSGSSGHILKITFKAKKAGQAYVRFASGAVLANDGKGTNILASMGSASYVVSPKVEAPKPSADTGGTESTKPKTEDKTESYDPDYNLPVVKSSTHSDPNRWYNANLAKFAWELPSGVTGVSIAYDQNPTSDPGPDSDGLFSEKEYADIKDGVWYLHLKFKDGKRWGGIAHFRTMIDTKAPEAFPIEINPVPAGDWPSIKFETKDEGSGLDKYLILLNSANEQSFELGAEAKEMKFENLEVGSHVVVVKALDKAGNEQVSAANLMIEPIAAPVITNYPQELKPGDNFYAKGTSVPDAQVTIYLERPGSQRMEKTVPSDMNGSWFAVFEDQLAQGRYAAWAKAENKNKIASPDGEKVSFLVTPPIFTVIGDFVINYFTVLVSLIFMIFLIIALGLYIYTLIKKRLRRETVEIEQVLHDNLSAYSRSLDEEFTRLSKFEGRVAYKAEKQKTQESLQKQIGAIEKKILKEVKDVEDMVK